MSRRLPLLLAIIGLFSQIVCGSQPHGTLRRASSQIPVGTLSINGIPFTTRAYWTRKANQALVDLASSPCLFTGLGELVCIGANSNRQTGNPTLHGEIAAISNCSSILTDPNGPYKLSPSEALAAFADLSLYTNAESRPMCASAIRWAQFREYIYGTSIDTLIEKGWVQLRTSSMEIFEKVVRSRAIDAPARQRLDKRDRSPPSVAVRPSRALSEWLLQREEQLFAPLSSKQVVS